MSNEKLWGGRFRSGTAASVEAFSQSVSFDWRLWPYDIQGSLAHAEALHAAGLLSDEEHQAIAGGLGAVAEAIESGEIQPKPELEDVHMNIEAALIERIGLPGKRLHTGRSRNDQVALDVRLWARDAVAALSEGIRGCQQTLLSQAEAHCEAILPAVTHLQHAQPVLLAHYLLAHVEALDRDYQRLQDCLKRINVMPLGAGAIAGSGLPIDRHIVAQRLGFSVVSANSIDTVSDRDHLCELVLCATTLMLHLSRLCEDWVLWSTPEFGFIEIDDAYCTGSSMMPQKKNPDVAELVRGKTGRVCGALTALVTMLKGTPTGYNRDFQEDKPPLFDAVDTAQACVSLTGQMVGHTRFHVERMREAAGEGHLDATAMADHLVRQGVPFREAHHIVGELVAAAIERDVALADLPLQVMRAVCSSIDAGVFGCLGPENVVAAYSTLGSSQPAMVAQQIAVWKDRLS